MLDFILKVIGREYQAFRSKPRHMEISLGATSNPVESPHQIVHSTMHMLPYRELTTRKGTVRISIGEDADKVIDKLDLFNPLYSRNQMAHSAMHIWTDVDGFDIANRICMFARHMCIIPIDQMAMYAYSRRNMQKPKGKGIYPTYSRMRDFDDIFAEELHKLNTEEQEENKDV